MNNSLVRQRKIRDDVIKDASMRTMRQWMVDMFIITLNDPEVMGKNVLGYFRIKKLLKAVGDNYDAFYTALTVSAEADYMRQKLDNRLKKIVGDNEGFTAFEERYPWMKKITYGKK